ncbi:MAG: hypothetical protein ACD_79C00972G0012 [uncultured bacterium]|nr:MAG: hypothetical protein ACD_79C00972G0012 [uncultured bacterium]
MELILFLILFPAIVSVFMLITPKGKVKDSLIFLSALVIIITSIALLFNKSYVKGCFFNFDTHIYDNLMFIIEVFIALFICYKGIMAKRFLAPALIVVQVAMIGLFEFKFGHKLETSNVIFIDKLSIIMGLIIGVIGSLISIHAIGYMKCFHEEHHPDFKDKRSLFFFIIFIFLSAMFGIVFSNNMLWFNFFWEITTLSSFILIGYKGNQESINNAFKALEFNLIGGFCMCIGIIICAVKSNTLGLDKIMILAKSGLLMLPIVLFSFAGITKSAQYPFSSWLLGAMVAPTPVSALLHSSTMVKAGVYLIVRLSPVFENNVIGLFLSLLGAITFLVASFVAVTQSDAKKILAYSTIANLGLIVICGGIGTYEGMWAGILLIIFHAIAKCLLFLCVGTTEHKIHSRDIEDMTGLILKMPKVSIMIQIGIAGMFLAPFGMLISKWAVLKALVDYNPFLAIFVIFGGAATLLFWVKWLGRIIVVSGEHENIEVTVSSSEMRVLGILSFLTIGICLLFPIVSNILIEPFVKEVYGVSVSMSHGNIVRMMIMMAMILLFPLSFFNYGKRVKVVDAYLGSANTDIAQFRGSLGDTKNISMGSYYFGNYFGENKINKPGIIICSILMILMLIKSFF